MGSMENSDKKTIVVAVSGGFDPLHIGHVRLMREAKKLGDKLVVILNNDNWLRKKKGYVFMDQHERKEIIEALECVDEVMLTMHSENSEDMSICADLERISPHVFANGGDRHHDNIPEVAVCDTIGCDMVFNVGAGGKVQSSSWLVDKHVQHKINSEFNLS
jgi:cytidyltransferase-like protein